MAQQDTFSFRALVYEAMPVETSSPPHVRWINNITVLRNVTGKEKLSDMLEAVRQVLNSERDDNDDTVAKATATTSVVFEPLLVNAKLNHKGTADLYGPAITNFDAPVESFFMNHPLPFPYYIFKIVLKNQASCFA